MSQKTRIGIRHPSGSSIYPQHPPGSRTLFRISESELTSFDRCVVAGSSVFVVGAFLWVPLLYIWAWRKWKSIPVNDERRRSAYAGVILLSIALLARGPHRSPRVGKWLRVRKWKLWTIWLKFIAMEVIADQDSSIRLNMQKDKAMWAFVPHGIFPFAFAFGVIPEISQQAFGIFRPVVATATNLLPVVRDLLLWLKKIDASRSAVDHALTLGNRIGIVPGGISEIFEGYPKQGSQPDEEYSIVRKGFLHLALQHGIPVFPVYCFGATKMFRRLDIPVLERLSSLVRASIVVFFGVWGLPIPFRQKLLYVIGNPITPPSGGYLLCEQNAVDEMHKQFCEELMRIFDRHKEAYGWEHKSLKLVTR